MPMLFLQIELNPIMKTYYVMATGLSNKNMLKTWRVKIPGKRNIISNNFYEEN